MKEELILLGIIVFVAFICVVVALIKGPEVGQFTIMRQCDNFNAFVVNGVKYQCSKSTD